MENLNKQREEADKIERFQVKAVLEMAKKVRERFDYADTAQWLAQDKNLEDLTMVSNSLSEWLMNPKISESKKKELTDLLMSIWRVMAYCQNIETICKTAVSKYSVNESKIGKLETEIRILKMEKEQLEINKNKEIDVLKKEIEFISK